MKKVLVFVAVIFAALLLIDSQLKFTQVFAQSGLGKSNQSSVLSKQDNTDRQLADTIRRLTDRSTVGLIEERNQNGQAKIDLQERFQNVMISRINEKGEPAAACVTSLGEANAFFGKNLETGEPVSSAGFEKDDLSFVAARHGMSEDEFEFYRDLIENARQNRLLNPNAATINIFNGDGPGEGFNDAAPKDPEGGNAGTTIGQQRLNLFNFAAGIWGAYLDSTVPITVNAQFNNLTPCSPSGGGVLGSAGTTTVFRDFPEATFPGTWHHAALANKLIGADPNGATAEINARFNTSVDNGCLTAGSRFYYGLDNTTPPLRVNLLIVLLHEMSHGLGFSSFVNGGTGVLFNNFPDVFTRYMFDRSTNKYWYQMTDAERQASAFNGGNVLWDGANVRIASGFLTNGRDSSGRVQLFTSPNPPQPGSSISHWDTAVSPNLLMEPNISLNLPLTLDLTRQQMRDIGWYRDTNADLIPDTITDVSPSSGSAIVIGSSATISWINTGNFNRNVTIELSTDGGATFPIVIASNVANTGTFTFTVPNLPTAQAQIRVREYDFVNPSGVSSANFTIGTVAPTSAALNGRVLIGSGRGLANTRLILVDQAGATYYARTNAFGYYRFANVPTGGNYTVNVVSKRYVFTQQSVNFIQDTTINFVAAP